VQLSVGAGSYAGLAGPCGPVGRGLRSGRRSLREISVLAISRAAAALQRAQAEVVEEGLGGRIQRGASGTSL